MTADPWPSRCLACHTALIDEAADFCKGTDCEQKYLTRRIRRQLLMWNGRGHLYRWLDRARGRI